MKGASSVEVRKLVTEYLIDDMLPLTTVESPAFKKLIDAFSPRPVQLPDRKTLCSHSEQAYESMMNKIKKIWKKLRCVDGLPQKVILE